MSFYHPERSAGAAGGIFRAGYSMGLSEDPSCVGMTKNACILRFTGFQCTHRFHLAGFVARL